MTVLLLLLVGGSVNAATVRADATPQSQPGYIEPGTPFTIDIYMNNNDGFDLVGYSMPFSIYSPDGSISNIIHRNVSGYSADSIPYAVSYNDSSILMLNGFDGYWGLINRWFGFGWNGVLPDTINHTTATMTGWPSGLGEQLYIQFALQSNEEGTLCIDSIAHENNVYDWLFDAATSFNGPYCWVIGSPPEDPEIAIDTDSLGFAFTPGQAVPPAQEINITNVGAGELNWTATFSSSWLAVSTSSGTAPSAVQVSVDPSGLTPEIYFDTLVISDPAAVNNPQSVVVTLEVISTPPVLDQIATGPLNVTELDSLKLDISASDPDGTVPSLTAEDVMDNASFEDNGDGTGSFAFYPDTTQAGTYFVTFIASDGELADSETVEIIVDDFTADVACLSVDPKLLEFDINACDPGLPDTQFVVITDCNEVDLNWSVTGDQSWVNFDPTSGLNFDSVAVWIDIDTLLESIAFTYLVDDTVYINAMLTISAPGADSSPQYVDINAMVYCDPAENILVVDPAEFEFTLAPDDVFVDAFYVSEAYGQNIEFEWANSESWLVLPSVMTPLITPDSVDFYVDAAGLASGTYYDTIVITSPDGATNAPVNVPVTLNITEEPTLVVEPTSFEFTIEPGDSLFGVDSLIVYEAGGENIDFWLYNWNPWLDLDTSGVIPLTTPKTVPLNILSGSLTPGTYYDSIQVNAAGASNTPLYVPVTLTVEDVVTFEVATLPESFLWVLGQDEVIYDSLFVYETHDANVPFGFINEEAWLTVEPLGMPPYVTPISLGITATSAGLPTGVYTDTILIFGTSPDSLFDTVGVPVVLQVEGEVTEDSVWVSNVPGVPGSNVIVPVYFRNFEPLAGINLPLTWDSDAIYLHEVTFDGTRVDYVDVKSVSIDNSSRRVQIGITPTFTPPVDDGRGLLARLHFSIEPGTPPDFVRIDTTTILPSGGLIFISDFLDAIYPTYVFGGVLIDTSASYVCGRVIDTAGNEIEGATVELWDDFPGGGLFLTEITDINGQFACGTSGISPFDAYAYKEGYYPGLLEGIEYGEIGFDIVLTPVGELNPTNEWVNFFCENNNYYMDVPMPAGSVVDAYDPDGIHCGTYFVTDPGSYGFMKVYRDDFTTGEDEGAEPGDTVSFYINGYPADASGNTIWTANGDTSEVCLDVFSVEDRMIPLDSGWNLISWNVDTPEDDIEDLLYGISDCIEVVLGFEQGGFTYVPTLPQFSDLRHLDHLHGYWVKMTCAETLMVTGVPVAATTPIHVEAGWNLVSYLPDEPDSIALALASIHDQLIVALGFDGVALTYDPDLPLYSDLDNMVPGFGYWVKIMFDDVLIYPGAGPSIVFRRTFAGTSKRTISAPEISPSRTWMNLYSHELTLDGNILPAGTEIEAVDASGQVVGYGLVREDGLFGFMPVYGDDPATSAKEGPARGEEFRLVVNGVETAEAFLWDGQGTRFEISFALNSLAGGEDLIPEGYALSQNYPNPFNPTTTISFTVPNTMPVKLEIYNILGEKVRTVFDGMADPGTTSVEWNGLDEAGQPVATGIYLYRMKAEQFEESRKMVLMK